MGGLSDDEDGEDKDQGKDDKGNESDSDILPGYVPRDIGEERPLFWDGKGKRTLDELKSRNSDGLEGWWRPIRPTPRVAWPGGKIKTEWYENMYTSLYLRTKKFVDDYFGYGQLPRARKIHGIEYSLWLEIPEKLRRYIALVARQDNTLPWGWDDLLMQRVHREYVIQGVIGKIFERYIWDELLFGANERQLELLEKEDRMTVDLGGFRRTANRADTVRMFLGAETETPLFWDKVDELTLKIITLLLPVINLLDDHFVKAREQSLRVIYQELHYLVTQAGLLAIGIRWSHDIFRFEWPIPGLPFDNEQQNVDQWPYDRSVRFARAFDEEAEQPTKEAPNPFLVTGDDDWRFPLDIFPFYGADKVLGYLYSVFVKFWNPLWNRMVRYGMRGLDPLSIKARRDMFLKPTKTHSPHRMAKVQIAVWPTFARHEVVGQLGEHPVAGHLDMDGERITIMMKAPVVYYSGLEGATEDHAERIPTLEEHVLAHRLAIYWEEWGQYIKWFVLLTIGWVILLTTLAAIFPAFGAVVRAFTYFLMGSIKALIRQVTLWSLAVLGNLIRAAVGTRKVFRFLYYALGNTVPRKNNQMDASALLKSQGWRGKGFSLHPTNNNIGLSKPILVARNTDGRGIGQKPHVTSDTWWLDAFDQKLKGLDTSKKGTVTQSVAKGKLDVIVATGKSGKYTGASGLYASFVSGGLLEGTLKYSEESTSTTSTTDATPVSSSSEDDDSSASGSGARKKSKKESREGETKQERKMRREARRLRKAQRATTKEAKKAAKKEAKEALKATETKEERRARRIARRARKEAKRSKRAKEAVS
ncbi:hypothetical protein V8F20_010465 [Naviculisporaceae sp. PSN 640]